MDTFSTRPVRSFLVEGWIICSLIFPGMRPPFRPLKFLLASARPVARPIEHYGVGTTASAWFEYPLCALLLLTAVVT